MDADADEVADRAREQADRAQEEAAGWARRLMPGSLRRVFQRAVRHHTATLAAGLAFFGIVSLGPAIGAGIGLLQLVVPGDRVDQMVELLQDGFPETLGLADVIEQMEEQAGQYLGVGLLVLLWPASTLASGWTRALDAVNEFEPSGVATGGIQGRLRGIGPGAVLLLGLLLLLGAVLFGGAVLGQGALLAAVVGPGAVAVVLVLTLVIYRWLPSEARQLSQLWRGAVWATAGMVAATVGFAAALTFGEGLAEQYPPALSTAVILGLWLYLGNLALLLGDEYNAARAQQSG